MSDWLRVTTTVDILIEDGETPASVLRDLMQGISEGEGEHARLISAKARQVRDA